jgi:hypothetical protein
MFVVALDSLANDEDSISIGVGEHLGRLANGLEAFIDGRTSQEAIIAKQQAYLGANYQTFMPEGVTPHQVLAGEHGVEAQRMFLLGAVAALDNLMSAAVAK